MVHSLPVKACSKQLPKHRSLVYFWDIYGIKRIGFYFRTFKFIELNSGHAFEPNKDISYWQYKD